MDVVGEGPRRVWRLISRFDSLLVKLLRERVGDSNIEKTECGVSRARPCPMRMLAMKLQITTAALVFVAIPALAQTTGVSNPEPVTITTTDDNAATPALTPRTQTAKPSAATPAVAPAPASAGTAVYGPYVPYSGPAVAGSAQSNATPADDLDAMIVTSVPEREGELREGTLLKTRIKENLSTATTMQGSRFTAELTEAIREMAGWSFRLDRFWRDE